MWVKQCHKPPMTGNGLNPTYKNADDWGLVKKYCFTHIRWDDLWEYHQIISRAYDPWHDLGAAVASTLKKKTWGMDKWDILVYQKKEYWMGV